MKYVIILSTGVFEEIELFPSSQMLSLPKIFNLFTSITILFF